MIAETPNLQRTVSQSEERYTNLIKQEFIKHAKEINRLGAKIEDLERQLNAISQATQGD